MRTRPTRTDAALLKPLGGDFDRVVTVFDGETRSRTIFCVRKRGGKNLRATASEYETLEAKALSLNEPRVYEWDGGAWFLVSTL